jgi:hypothetical protein
MMLPRRVRYALPPHIPDDLVGRIIADCACLVLQRAYRSRYLNRYRRDPRWYLLENRVIRLVGRDKLDELRAVPRVRAEWAYEMSSWLSMLQQPDAEHVLRIICDECRCGIWSHAGGSQNHNPTESSSSSSPLETADSTPNA